MTRHVWSWPSTPEELTEVQRALAGERPPPWSPSPAARIGACFVCFARGEAGPGATGDRGWAAAAAGGETAVVEGAAGAPYLPSLLTLREGPLLEAAVRSLSEPPELLLVDATGRDHPRRAGLALHLGAVLALPTVGVTHRTLLACGDRPPDLDGARSPLVLDGELVGFWLGTRRGIRPLAVHAAWQTDPEAAVEAVRAALGRVRTPEPLRLARRAARVARGRTAP